MCSRFSFQVHRPLHLTRMPVCIHMHTYRTPRSRVEVMSSTIAATNQNRNQMILGLAYLPEQSVTSTTLRLLYQHSFYNAQPLKLPIQKICTLNSAGREGRTNGVMKPCKLHEAIIHIYLAVQLITNDQTFTPAIQHNCILSPSKQFSVALETSQHVKKAERRSEEVKKRR